MLVTLWCCDEAVVVGCRFPRADIALWALCSRALLIDRDRLVVDRDGGIFCSATRCVHYPFSPCSPCSFRSQQSHRPSATDRWCGPRYPLGNQDLISEEGCRYTSRNASSGPSGVLPLHCTSLRRIATQGPNRTWAGDCLSARVVFLSFDNSLGNSSSLICSLVVVNTNFFIGFTAASTCYGLWE